MWPVVLSVLLSTTPPLVAGPEALRPPLVPSEVYVGPPQARVLVPRGRPPVPPPPPATFALYFAPLSLFALTLWVEGDLHLGAGFSVFANVGGGPLGQFGGDAGFRYYVLEKPFEGFYLDARASAFSLPAQSMLMVGPGVQVGYGWRVSRFALSVGMGFTTWYGLSRANGSTSFFGATVTDAEVIALPGFTQPPLGTPGVQPTVRISLGPTF